MGRDDTPPPHDGNELPEDFHFDCNPNGPWAHVEDEFLKRALLKTSAEHFPLLKAQHPDLPELKDFVDRMTLFWIQAKEKVEAESMRNSFVPCENLSHVSQGDRPRVAILALSINGSFILLGNGCLVQPGSSARYERIPLRQNGQPLSRFQGDYVVCAEDPSIHKSLRLANAHVLNVSKTSPLYLLFYTTRLLPEVRLRRVAAHLSESLHTSLDQTVFRGLDETVRNPDRREENPQEFPVEEPERVEI